IGSRFANQTVAEAAKCEAEGANVTTPIAPRLARKTPALKRLISVNMKLEGSWPLKRNDVMKGVELRLRGLTCEFDPDDGGNSSNRAAAGQASPSPSNLPT